MKTTLFITLIGALFLWGSCDVSEPIYETPHPEQAQITVSANWSDVGQGITKPSSYQVAYGSTALTATSDTYTIPNLFAPGNYTVYFYNAVTGIPVKGTTARVGETTVPQGLSGHFIESLPGWFFTGKLQAGVQKDTNHDFEVKMHQQVRQLTIVVEPKGETGDHIKSITASLSGVAGTLDIDSEEHGTASDILLDFTKISSGTDAGKWFATVRLLGVTGSGQRLSGTMAFTGGSPNDITLDSDLTTALANFNADKKTPLTLGGEVVETPSGVGLGPATIQGWQEQSTISGEVESE